MKWTEQAERITTTTTISESVSAHHTKHTQSAPIFSWYNFEKLSWWYIFVVLSHLMMCHLSNKTPSCHLCSLLRKWMLKCASRWHDGIDGLFLIENLRFVTSRYEWIYWYVILVAMFLNVFCQLQKNLNKIKNQTASAQITTHAHNHTSKAQCHWLFFFMPCIASICNKRCPAWNRNEFLEITFQHSKHIVCFIQIKTRRSTNQKSHSEMWTKRLNDWNLSNLCTQLMHTAQRCSCGFDAIQIYIFTFNYCVVDRKIVKCVQCENYIQIFCILIFDF